MPRGLPRIQLGPGQQVQQSGGLRQLDKQEAYKYRDRPVPRAVVNPISANQRVKLNATVAGAPDPEEFALPRNWKVTRRERIVPAKDNIFHGSCRKRNQDGSLGKKDKPRLRSLAEVYECLYTDRKRKTPFCNGNPQPPCPELYTQASRGELNQRAPRLGAPQGRQSPRQSPRAQRRSSSQSRPQSPQQDDGFLRSLMAFDEQLMQAVERSEQQGVPAPELADIVVQLTNDLENGLLPPLFENDIQRVGTALDDYAGRVDWDALAQNPEDFQPAFPWD